ncbi:MULTISPECIES: HDOD domain-containing protein [Dyella]|uniref:HDOD domain-containing protein n=2 Tax=Dyella TaxID=231454 RepID=A0A4R0YVW6_9GAMM|nr:MULTISPECIES: HDOD domain-containing protein [Dyella]TBR39769.1 HDOD domain-containing protein [Dyella terrae]TCI12651.1 HDOD domain-containing protein [Dyella soli]
MIWSWRRLFSQPAAPERRPRPPLRAPQAAQSGLAGDGVSSAQALMGDLEDRFHRFMLGLPDYVDRGIDNGEPALLRRMQIVSERFDVRSLPRLPAVLPQLLHALKNDNVAGAELARLVGRDPMLVGEVMRVSRSIYYRTLHSIQSLQHAVVLLGQDGLRRVATQHMMKPILQASAGARGLVAGQRLWDHAERCAHASAFLGKYAGCDPFESYLAGIVCNTGTGAIIHLLDAEEVTMPELLSADFLNACAGLSHRLTLRAARHWELPENVIRALSEQGESDTKRSPLGKTLYVANRLAMAQLLGDHHILESCPDLSQVWPDQFAPTQVARCQQDLQHQFDHAETSKYAI